MSLAAKIRAQREHRIAIDKYTFVVRRPTKLQMVAMREALVGGTLEQKFAALLPFVVGWDGVTELDVLAGGGPLPVLFDSEGCAEWLGDREDLLVPLCSAIGTLCAEHLARAEAAEKN